MLIYKQEKQDGLEEVIRASSSIAALCPILTTKVSLDSLPDLSVSIAENLSDSSLHKIYSILVSVGWNLNDDIFLREEVWKARHTPSDKPFNFEHNPRHIIGHITKSCVVDESYKLIDDNESFDNLPDKFHILTSAVLYRHKPSLDKDLTKETQELIESIASGDWYVSMECLFPHFDYALSYADGRNVIVERTEDTCFLSKYLKVYKGTGTYEDAKLGRCLRNITFSGKGLVKVPGNPESYIFSDTKKFIGIAGSLSIGRKEMTVESKSVAVQGEPLKLDLVSREEYATAQKEISDLRARLEAAKEENVKKQIADIQAVASKKDEEISSLKTELDNVKASKKEVETSLATLTEKVSEVSKKLVEAEEKIAKAESDKIISNRVSTLLEKGVDKDEAEKIVAAAATTSDEVFALLVEAHAKLVEAKKTVVVKETEKAKADTQKLEEVKKDETSIASLTTETVNDGETAIANLRNLFASYIDGGK